MPLSLPPGKFDQALAVCRHAYINLLIHYCRWSQQLDEIKKLPKFMQVWIQTLSHCVCTAFLHDGTISDGINSK